MTEMAPVNLFHGLAEPVSKDGLMNRLTRSVVQETSVLVMTSICAWESCPRSTRGSTITAERDRILLVAVDCSKERTRYGQPHKRTEYPTTDPTDMPRGMGLYMKKLFLFSFRAMSGPILLRRFCLGGKCMATPHRRPYLSRFSYAIVTDISSRMTRIKVSKSMGYTKPFGHGG
jgi:hypothetical protein